MLGALAGHHVEVNRQYELVPGPGVDRRGCRAAHPARSSGHRRRRRGGHVEPGWAQRRKRNGQSNVLEGDRDPSPQICLPGVRRAKWCRQPAPRRLIENGIPTVLVAICRSHAALSLGANLGGGGVTAAVEPWQRGRVRIPRCPDALCSPQRDPCYCLFWVVLAALPCTTFAEAVDLDAGWVRRTPG